MINYDIIRRPIITEKTNIQKDNYNHFYFEVSPIANRAEIRSAIENIFNVNVVSVRTMHIKGKVKQRGRITGKRRNWKKAIVKLIPGQKIDFFDGL